MLVVKVVMIKKRILTKIKKKSLVNFMLSVVRNTFLKVAISLICKNKV